MKINFSQLKIYLQALENKSVHYIKSSITAEDIDMFCQSFYKLIPDNHFIVFILDYNADFYRKESILHRYLRSAGHDLYSIKRYYKNQKSYHFIYSKEKSEIRIEKVTNLGKEE